MAGSPMTGVEAFRIERVEPLHPARERSRSANQKMPVGVHEAVRPDVPSVEFRGVTQQAEDIETVPVVEEHRLTIVAVHGNVVKGTVIVDAKFLGHGLKIRTDNAPSGHNA